MNKLARTRRNVNTPAASWPSTPEIDGFTWELGPDPADLQWAAENLNDDHHSTDPTPDDVLDRMADEATALDRYERGLI